ncbi:MAG: prolyl oligopeptidase family serine peptidase [Sedimentisphaerales bacterium]|nr:prolyl oligopeptidase family serine peptidase [Sedimentisphaerales bacterium]
MLRIMSLLLMFSFVGGCTSMEFLSGGNKSDSLNKPGRHVITEPVTFTTDLDYIAYLPDDYGKDPDKKWPLVMFLHGVGERGSDVQKVEKHGLPALASRGQKFDFIIIAPQCPPSKFWPDMCVPLVALLDDASNKWNVDEDRVYLTGLSMGGFGTWSLACAYPERFAAIAPICGGGMTFMASALRNMPIWVFHGEKDSVVPISRSEEMVNAIKSSGGNPRFTRYPDLNHDSWTVTYANPELYQWLLSNVRTKKN